MTMINNKNKFNNDCSSDIRVTLKLNQRELDITRTWLMQETHYICKSYVEDCYFDNPHNSWFRTHKDGYRYALKFLRIRESASGSYVQYKDLDSCNSRKYSENDYNLQIPNSTGYKNLLHSIGFVENTIIQKTTLSYSSGQYLINLNNVANIGNFVEFIVKTRSHQKENDEYQMLINFIKNIGINKYKTLRQNFILLAWNPNFKFRQ